MGAFRFLIAYFLFASVLASACAYPAYLLAGPDLMPFAKWVTRLALLFLILGLYPTCKLLKLTRAELGFSSPKSQFLKQLGRGFGYGLIILLIPFSMLLLLGVRTPDFTGHAILPVLATGLIGGLIVGLIEETLFRGLFYRIVDRELSAYWAIGLTSLIYAVVHFIKPAQPPSPDEIDVWSGFTVMAQSYLGIFSANLSDLTALFFVGVLLAQVRHNSGSLALSIGMHASWVFLIKLIKTLTDSPDDAPWRFLAGNYDGIIGWLVAVWLACLWLAFLKFRPFTRQPAA